MRRLIEPGRCHVIAWALAIVAMLPACGVAVRAPAVPQMRLAPTSLLDQLVVQHQLEIGVAGRTLLLDAALEADGSSLRMMLSQFGHTLVRASWDGANLQTWVSPAWPAQLPVTQFISDIHYVWWPREALQQRLPAGWTLNDKPGERTLLQDGHVAMRIVLQAPGVLIIDRQGGPYRVTIRLHDHPGPAFTRP